METIKSQYHDHSGRIGFDGLSKSAYKFIETIIGLKIPFSHGAQDFLPFNVKMEIARRGHKISLSIYSRMGSPIGTYMGVTGNIGDKALEYRGCHNSLGAGLTGKAVNNIQLDDTLYVVLTWVKYFQIDVYTQITDK